MLRCPADQPGVELGASDLARRGKASGARRNSTANGYIAQWLERLTADQHAPGSNPGVPSVLS